MPASKLTIDADIRDLFLLPSGTASAAPDRAAANTIQQAAGSMPGFRPARSLPQSNEPSVVHNDHRIVVNYNASGQGARRRQLTDPSTERNRSGSF